MNRGWGGATTTEIAAAVASVILAAVATFVRSDQVVAATTGTFLCMTLGFVNLAYWRQLSVDGRSRAQIRLWMSGAAFVMAAAIFLFYPALA